MPQLLRCQLQKKKKKKRKDNENLQYEVLPVFKTFYKIMK